jgi:hypothetical protein
MHPEHRSIGELAYRLWQARGCPEGSAEQDWLDAEKQLRSMESTESTAIDSSLRGTFPASDPPASQPTGSTGRSRRSKSTQGKPSAEPPH